MSARPCIVARWGWGALALWLFVGFACSDDDPKSQPDVEEDAPTLVYTSRCLGLMPFASEDPTDRGAEAQDNRRFWLPRFGDWSSDGCRVNAWFAEDGGSGGGDPGLFGAKGGLTLTLWRQGIEWSLDSGSLVMLRKEDTRIDAGFDGLANAWATKDDPARMVGTFEGCAYGKRSDCPYITDGGLVRTVSMRLPNGLRQVFSPSTYASECRALIDRETGALQVDLQIGVFNGVNVAHWSDQCRTDTTFPNSFRFRTGGVTEPGTYGPFVTRNLDLPDGGSIVLPELSVQIPIVYFGTEHACAAKMGSVITVAAARDRTECTFSVLTSPKEFALSCTQVGYQELGEDAENESYLVDGSFEIRSRCDIEIR